MLKKLLIQYISVICHDMAKMAKSLFIFLFFSFSFLFSFGLTTKKKYGKVSHYMMSIGK